MKDTAYIEAFNRAVDKANRLGVDVGILRNKLFGTYEVFLLPQPHNRSGHDLRAEVVRPGTPKMSGGLGLGAVEVSIVPGPGSTRSFTAGWNVRRVVAGAGEFWNGEGAKGWLAWPAQMWGHGRWQTKEEAQSAAVRAGFRVRTAGSAELGLFSLGRAKRLGTVDERPSFLTPEFFWRSTVPTGQAYAQREGGDMQVKQEFVGGVGVWSYRLDKYQPRTNKLFAIITADGEVTPGPAWDPTYNERPAPAKRRRKK